MTDPFQREVIERLTRMETNQAHMLQTAATLAAQAAAEAARQTVTNDNHEKRIGALEMFRTLAVAGGSAILTLFGFASATS